MIEVMLQTECPDGTERIIKRAAEGALKQQKAGGDISVLVTDDDTIWKMNREYRNVDRATDVLSFPSCDGDAIAAAPDLRPKNTAIRLKGSFPSLRYTAACTFWAMTI